MQPRSCFILWSQKNVWKTCVYSFRKTLFTYSHYLCSSRCHQLNRQHPLEVHLPLLAPWCFPPQACLPLSPQKQQVKMHYSPWGGLLSRWLKAAPVRTLLFCNVIVLSLVLLLWSLTGICFFALPWSLIFHRYELNLNFFYSKCETSRGLDQRFWRRQPYTLRCGQWQTVRVTCSTGDDPARPGHHAGSQTAFATSSWNAKSSSTSILLTKHATHAPANDAQRTHVSTGRIQNAHALPSSWISLSSTSFGTRGYGRQRREAFPEREARVRVPTLPQREVVEES